MSANSLLGSLRELQVLVLNRRERSATPWSCN